MKERSQSDAEALRDDTIAISAYDSVGACIARELRSALKAYTREIDLIDEPACRRALNVRRIVAEQRASESDAITTRWSMLYDENGALTDAIEQELSGRRAESPTGIAGTGLKLAQRLRWIGVPGIVRP